MEFKARALMTNMDLRGAAERSYVLWVDEICVHYSLNKDTHLPLELKTRLELNTDNAMDEMRVALAVQFLTDGLLQNDTRPKPAEADIFKRVWMDLGEFYSEELRDLEANAVELITRLDGRVVTDLGTVFNDPHLMECVLAMANASETQVREHLGALEMVGTVELGGVTAEEELAMLDEAIAGATIGIVVE